MARRFILLGAVVAVALGALVAPGLGAKANDPGVTKTSILIGATYPETGVAAVYGTIPKAETAFYQDFNAHGSVNGRKINYKFLDDGYNLTGQTLPLTKQLVEQDHVFAIVGSLGTQPNLATEGYLNKNKVPQVLIATGDAFWSEQYKKFPWTFGGLGTYTGEARLMAGYLNKSVKNAKIGVVYQNDNYGKPYLAALRKYLGPNGDKIVSAVPYDASQNAIPQQITQLKASGANVLYVMALPAQTISGLVTETQIGWHPKATIVNAVGASAKFMEIAAAQGADINGDITSGMGPNPDDPANAKLAVVKHYLAVMKQLYPKGDVTDPNNFGGFAGGWLTAYALSKSGNPPTRAGLLNALTHLNITGGTGKGQDPYLFPGYKIHTTPTDRFLLPEAKLERWGGGKTGFFTPFGPLVGNLKG